MSGISALLGSTRNNFITKLFKDGILNMKLVLLGAFGVILLVAGGIFDRQPTPVKNNVITDAPKMQVNRSYEEILEAKLAGLLTQVRGAGNVSVTVTLESGGAVEHAKNIVKETKIVQEKDNSGGLRTTTESKESEQILMSKENNADRPVMVREYKPMIKGILVVAEGALDSTVKANLTKAVETGLGIPSYKITVLPQKK